MGEILCAELSSTSELRGVTLASKGLDSTRPKDLSMNSAKLEALLVTDRQQQTNMTDFTTGIRNTLQHPYYAAHLKHTPPLAQPVVNDSEVVA